MKTRRQITNVLTLAVAMMGMVVITAGPAQAAIIVVGVNTNTDAAYGADASAADLVNSGAASLAGTAFSASPYFGPTAHNNGSVGAANTTADITFWIGASGGSTYSITYTLDVSVNTFGYDITSIQTIHGWTNNSGNQKNQNYVVAASTVGDSGFTDVATVAYLPFTSANNTASTKVNITENATGTLVSGVDEIRFTYTVPASGGNNPSPTIREVDVFGAATFPEPASAIVILLGALGFKARSRRQRSRG